MCWEAGSVVCMGENVAWPAEAAAMACFLITWGEG